MQGLKLNPLKRVRMRCSYKLLQANALAKLALEDLIP